LKDVKYLASPNRYGMDKREGQDIRQKLKTNLYNIAPRCPGMALLKTKGDATAACNKMHLTR
jgi:hypothetical protein